MCRLFGMSAGEEPARATFWLLDAPDSLASQSHREPDGTGLGWFDSEGRPKVSKQPLAAYADREFATRAHEVSSRTFLAHVRFASTGAVAARNTHPFELDSRLFAHNGVLGDLTTLDAHLGDALRQVKGDTDSERLFALITREIATAHGEVADGIAAACQWVASTLPLFAINFILATAEGLWALRYPDTHDLFVLERPPGTAVTHTSSLGTRVTSPHGADRPLVVLATERLDADPGWRQLTPGELLHVSPTPDVSSRSILDGPPAHPLTLEDLGAAARRSQETAATSAER